MTSDPRTMDLRLHASHLLHFGVNGRHAGQADDDALQFLSQEEQECLQFFEDTIDSLEVSLEGDDLKQTTTTENHSGAEEEVDVPPTSSSNPGVLANPLARTPKDQDIIDLVCPELDMVEPREPIFNPTNPDFQSLLLNPESHFEVKPKRDPAVSLPSEYSPLIPSGSYGPTDGHSYHPPGSIPTPVLIAQKIAENQAGEASNLQPTSLVRHSSLEKEKPSSYSSNTPIKQGPPPSARPNRFPANINVILGSKDHLKPVGSNVSIEERRGQMLANLTGSHPLLQEAPQQTVEQKLNNIPKRSISFKDPSPDQSRMEALSKLGLTRNRAMSGGLLLLNTPKSTSLDQLTGVETRAKSLEAPTSETSIKAPEDNVTTPSLSQINADRRAEILRTHSLGSHEARNPQRSPSPLAANPEPSPSPPAANPEPSPSPPAANPEPSPSPPAANPEPSPSPPAANTNWSPLPPAASPPRIPSPPAPNPEPSHWPPAPNPEPSHWPPAPNPEPSHWPPAPNPEPSHWPPAPNPEPSPSLPAANTKWSPLPLAASPPRSPSPPAPNPPRSPSPPVVPQSHDSPPPLENKPPASPPPDVTSPEFNSYGGKSIVVNPSLTSKSEPAISPMTRQPKILSPALPNSCQFNSFGGKSKVVTPAPVAANRSDLPDILSSHINKSQTLPPKSEPQTIVINSYGGMSRTINPSAGLNRPINTPTRSHKAPAPAPKPSRHSYHGPVTAPTAAQRGLSPDHKQRSGSLFRPQSITVKFSGKNGTEESRRDALRKLGLLKDS